MKELSPAMAAVMISAAGVPAVFSRDGKKIEAPVLLSDIPASLTLEGVAQEAKGQVVRATVATADLTTLPTVGWRMAVATCTYNVIAPPEVNSTLGMASFPLRKSGCAA